MPQISKPKHGNEPLHQQEVTLPFILLDFWKWSVSDLLSNATRGRLAEFIVATALKIPLDRIRDEWAAWYEAMLVEVGK